MLALSSWGTENAQGVESCRPRNGIDLEGWRREQGGEQMPVKSRRSWGSDCLGEQRGAGGEGRGSAVAMQRTGKLAVSRAA